MDLALSREANLKPVKIAKAMESTSLSKAQWCFRCLAKPAKAQGKLSSILALIVQEVECNRLKKQKKLKYRKEYRMEHRLK